MKKKALVLSGGSIKGAFHVGAIKRLVEEGFIPDIILGISIGATSAAYMVNQMGQQGDKQDFEKAVLALEKFWFYRATKPKAIMKRRPLLLLGYQFITKKFKSIMDTSQYFSWFDELKYEYIRQSKIKLIVGAVNIHG